MLNDVTLQSLLLGDGDLLLDSHFRVRGTATCLQRMLGTNTEPWQHRQLLMPFGKLETAATNRFGKIFQRWTEDFSGTSLVDLMVEESLSALTQDVCPHFDPFYDWSIIPTSSYLCWEKKNCTMVLNVFLSVRWKLTRLLLIFWKVHDSWAQYVAMQKIVKLGGGFNHFLFSPIWGRFSFFD